MIYGLAEAYGLNICNEKIICMLKQWAPCLESYLSSMNVYKVYLATSLKYVNTLIPSIQFEKQIRILLYATDFKSLVNEINPKMLNVRFGWPGFAIILKSALKLFSPDYPNYLEMESAYDLILNKYQDTLNDIKPSPLTPRSKQQGICEGVAGMRLFSLVWPDL